MGMAPAITASETLDWSHASHLRQDPGPSMLEAPGFVTEPRAHRGGDFSQIVHVPVTGLVLAEMPEEELGADTITYHLEGV